MSNVYRFIVPARRFGIDIKKAWEVNFWATTLGISEEKLRAAVKVVGPQVAALRSHLKADVTSQATTGATIFSIATSRSLLRATPTRRRCAHA